MMSKKQTTTIITYEAKEKIISDFSKVDEIKFLRLEILLRITGFSRSSCS